MEMRLTNASTGSLVARGIVALVFGIMALVWPSITLHVILILFALYALISGAISAVAAVIERHENDAWPLGLIFGIISALIGLYLLGNPAVTAVVLVFLIALYAIVVGVIDLVAGITLRKVIKGEWLLIIVGILSILVGLWLFANPGGGIIGLIWFVAIYALVAGFFWLAAAASHHTAGKRVTAKK